jgi:hypothetical protein
MRAIILAASLLSCLACSGKAEWKATPTPKVGTEQTEGPFSDRYHPDVVEHYAPGRPLAVVGFEPLDLTTGVSMLSPLRVTVNNLGENLLGTNLKAANMARVAVSDSSRLQSKSSHKVS